MSGTCVEPLGGWSCHRQRLLIERHRDRRDSDREAEIDKDRETERNRDRVIERERQTQRQGETGTERQRERAFLRSL